MTEDLDWILRQLVHGMLREHPLPWRVERDWTYEVLDPRGLGAASEVMKCHTASQAMALIALAEEVDRDHRRGAAEVDEMFEGDSEK